MGRSGGGCGPGRAASSVFRVAGGRAAKARARRGARPVTTALRRINIVNAEKVRALDRAFSEIQEEMQQQQQQPSTDTAAEPQQEPQVSNDPEHEPANVDAATDLLSQL